MGGPVLDDLGPGEAAGLAWSRREQADDLDAAAGLAKGSPISSWNTGPGAGTQRGPQIDSQPFALGEQALRRRRVGRSVPADHPGDPVIDKLDELRAGLGLQVLGVESSQ